MNNELVPQPNWWKRNWKWALPVGGCLSLIIIGIIAVGTIVYGVTNAIEDSKPYEYALQKINTDEDLIKALGSPIEREGMVSGNWNYSNGQKTADMRIPVAGPKGEGILFVEASGEGDNWTYHVIRVVIEDQEPINVLQENLD